MSFRKTPIALAVAAACVLPLAAVADITFTAPVVVSKQQPDFNNAYKAKMAQQTYKSDAALENYDVDATVMVYADGPEGAQEIWIARSVDNGQTWSYTALTDNGGTPVSITQDNVTYDLASTNGKPNIYAPPTGAITDGKGANVMVSWASSYCRDLADPEQPSPVQKVNLNLTAGPELYKCMWIARTTDGGLSWTTQQLTDGSMDVDEDVPAGYTTSSLTGGGFALVFQADPLGLKQGNAEGPGEGASGASVSQGTNIWYSFLSKAAFESQTAFPAPVQVSDNTPENAQGASRPNLAISGGTAVLAYEETKGSSDTEGKRIVYHSFNYATPDTLSAGTGISNPAYNARRVRFALQGNEAIGDADLDGDAADGDTAGVHVLLMWRQQMVADPTQGSNVRIVRGIKNTALRPGSTGFLPTDIESYSDSQNLSDLIKVSSKDNALAHRGMLRGEKVAVAFDRTWNMAAANAVPPTATYNTWVVTSLDGGESWNTPYNASKISNPAIRVAEPRLVGTPGTIKLPNGSATGEPSDVQNTNVFFVSYGTETNEPESVPLDIVMRHTADFGATYSGKFVLAGGPPAQSETQIRSTPDGSSISALWMREIDGLIDVVFRNGAVSVDPQ